MIKPTFKRLNRGSIDPRWLKLNLAKFFFLLKSGIFYQRFAVISCIIIRFNLLTKSALIPKK